MRCRLQSWQVYCRLCETLGGYHSKRLQTVGSGTVRIQFFQSGLIPAESDAVSPATGNGAEIILGYAGAIRTEFQSERRYPPWHQTNTSPSQAPNANSCRIQPPQAPATPTNRLR